jgi:mono/diheme cytochrome c family protein
LRYLVSAVLILILAFFSLGCPTTTNPTTALPSPTAASPSPTISSPSPTATATGETSPSPQTGTPASPTASAAGLTFGQLANTGQTIYTNSCALCHGDSGQGGTASSIIGARANLQKYNTAQGLFDYIRTNMPASAPGSLPLDKYQQVMGYLLVQNNFVQSNTPFAADQLSTIQLTR